MALSEFEKQRQENIQRNKELLRSLDLESVSQSIKRELPSSEKPARKRNASSRTTRASKKAAEPAAPMRKSRRIAGIKTEEENPEEYRRQQAELEAVEKHKLELEKLKRTRLFGDFNLINLVTTKGGELKYSGIKDEPKDAAVKSEEAPEEIAGDNEVLTLLQSLGDKFSTGDFYHLIRSKQVSYDDKLLESKRKEFDNLHIYQKHEPLDIKLTHNRTTSINFHPTTTNRLIVGGDTTGNLGIWAVDDTPAYDSALPSVTILKPHGKAISKLLTPSTNFSKIYTSSYDGSVRELDLNRLSSSELCYLSDPYDSGELGVSDINIPLNSHTLYLTTLAGYFCQYDTREPFKQGQLLRLHDKKIGGFSINPNAEHQIATSSLDRTMRIWDLRKTGVPAWSEYDDQVSPHAYGSFRSRLSISTVDWNSENRLVCNGYDDTLNIFNLNEKPVVTGWGSDYQPPSKDKPEEGEIPENFTPINKIKHNCQTGRWVSILKARWQPRPQDGVQKFVIANMNRGLDVYDQNGEILAHLSESVGAVPAVATFHPTQNWVVGASASGKVYLFE